MTNLHFNRALATSSKSKSPATDDVDDNKKSPVLKGLAIISEHAMLRGNTTEDDTEVSSEHTIVLSCSSEIPNSPFLFLSLKIVT